MANVELSDAVRVEIWDDQDLCDAFLDFILNSLRNQQTWAISFRGGYTGLGGHESTFPAEAKPHIEKWFREYVVPERTQ